MKLYLVGGFLGSGKTTAIAAAAKILVRRGLKVGIVTNDQGRDLVDTGYFGSRGLAAVEVTEGCFCCNYDELVSRFEELRRNVRPDVIFAESVGSCADLVATVVRPLLESGKIRAASLSFSVFCDCRHVQRRLAGRDLPFSRDVQYIFDKQIEEAGVVVLNKIDLLSRPEAARLLARARKTWPLKKIMLQNSLVPSGPAGWLRGIETVRSGRGLRTVGMDYDRYGNGEAKLAWYDAVLDVRARGGKDAGAAVRRLVVEISDAVYAKARAVGHLKFLARCGGKEVKVSFTSLRSGSVKDLKGISGPSCELLVNCRAEMPAGKLRDLVRSAVRKTGVRSGVRIGRRRVSAFHPSYPEPTHRFQDPS